jgi:hypothetical protein
MVGNDRRDRKTRLPRSHLNRCVPMLTEPTIWAGRPRRVPSSASLSPSGAPTFRPGQCEQGLCLGPEASGSTVPVKSEPYATCQPKSLSIYRQHYQTIVINSFIYRQHYQTITFSVFTFSVNVPISLGFKRDCRAAPLAIQPLRGCSDNK